MSNTYTPDGQFVIDAMGERWAVNAWHAAGPLNGTPAGISALDENGNWSGEIAFKATDENRTGWWLARPPLPPIPLPKTQEQLDEEALWKWVDTEAFEVDRTGLQWLYTKAAFEAGIEHARKGLQP